MEEPLELSEADDETADAAKSDIEPALTAVDPIRPRAELILNRPVTTEVEMNKESTSDYETHELVIPKAIASQVHVPETPLSHAIQNTNNASVLKAPIISVDEYEAEEDETLNTEQIVRANLSILKDDLEVGAGESADLKTFTITSLSMARQNVLDENIILNDDDEEAKGKGGVVVDSGLLMMNDDEHEQTALTTLIVSTDMEEDDANIALKRTRLDSYACPQVIEPSEDVTCQQLESSTQKSTIERISTQQVRIYFSLLFNFLTSF